MIILVAAVKVTVSVTLPRNFKIVLCIHDLLGA